MGIEDSLQGRPRHLRSRQHHRAVFGLREPKTKREDMDSTSFVSFTLNHYSPGDFLSATLSTSGRFALISTLLHSFGFRSAFYLFFSFFLHLLACHLLSHGCAFAWVHFLGYALYPHRHLCGSSLRSGSLTASRVTSFLDGGGVDLRPDPPQSCYFARSLHFVYGLSCGS